MPILGLVGKSDEKDHSGDAGLDVRIIIKWSFRKWNVRVRIGKRLFMIGTVPGHLCLRQRTFGVQKF